MGDAFGGAGMALVAIAQTNPSSSRATAVTATLLFFPRPTSLRYRPLSRLLIPGQVGH
jgi:hypothetical protein